MGWVAALGILIALGLIPVGVSLRYEQKQFEIKFRALFLTFRIPKGKKKQKKEKPRKEEPEKQPSQTAPAEKKKGPGLKPADFQPFIRLALDFLGSLRRKLRVNRLEGKVILASQDPCDLAVNYGRTWAGVSALLANLDRIFVIKEKDVNVECDFTAEKTVYSGRLDLTMTIGRILSLALRYGFRALIEFIRLKKRKGGAAV